MELKATANLDHKLTDARGKALAHPVTELIVSGEFLPAVPIQHHILAALFAQKNPDLNAEFSNDNGVLTFKLTISHEEDMVAAGKEAHDLEVEAANHVPPVTVAQLVEKKAKAAAEKGKKEAAAKAAAEK